MHEWFIAGKRSSAAEKRFRREKAHQETLPFRPYTPTDKGVSTIDVYFPCPFRQPKVTNSHPFVDNYAHAYVPQIRKGLPCP